MNTNAPCETLNIVSLNPWSVCNKTTDLSEFIADHEIDILCLTETWLTGSERDNPIIAELVPHGYNIRHTPRETRGGGTAIIHRSSLRVSQAPVLAGECDFSTFECQECLLRGSRTVRLFVLYRPPNNRNHTMGQFFEEFANLLEALSTWNGHILITGDLNIHMDDPADRVTNEMKALLSSFGLEQHVKQRTHRSGHILDIWTDDHFVTSVIAEDHGFPDHFPVFIETCLDKPHPQKTTVSYRPIKRIDRDALKSAILQSPLTNMDPELPLEEQVSLYASALSSILNEMAPLKKKTIATRRQAEWYNERIREAKQLRRRAERKWRGSRLHVDREAFMEHRQKVNELIEASKSEHYRNIISNCSNSKQLFKVLNQLLGRRRDAVALEKSPSELADLFSHFFIQKISDIRDSIPNADDPTPPFSLPGCSFTNFSPVTEAEIIRLIASSPSKCCELDPLPTELVKANKIELAPAICSIINKSLADGVFPAPYKTALVRPLLKKQSLDPETLKHYRPVSNLSFISKIMEKVVASQISAYLSENGLLEAQQSAYRSAHNTETALLHVFDDVLRSIGNRQCVLFVALDLSAAFDTVDYGLMEQTLARLGVQGTAASWFQTYLRGREQKVVVRGATSNQQALLCGVAQGSVLGPLLFTLYTASLGRVLRRHGVHFHFYADDTQVWLPFHPTNMDDALLTMQKCILDVQRWMSYHQLKMNCSKTEYLVISSRHDARTYDLQRPINIDGQSISPSATPIRNLGVFVDPLASMEACVTHVCKVCYIYIHNLNRIKKFLDYETLEKLIHCFISSKLDYCNSLFLGLPASLIKRLQRVQNVAARILTSTLRYEHITPILFQLHWLPVKARVIFKVLLLVHKCFYQIGPSYLCDLMVKENSFRPLRSADQDLLFVPFTHSTFISDRVFSVAGPRMWNLLPHELRHTQDVTLFKKHLKTLLFKEHYREFF